MLNLPAEVLERHMPGVHVSTGFRPVPKIYGKKPNGEKCQRKMKLFIN